LNLNFKLFLKYILFNIGHFYLSHTVQGGKNISIVMSKSTFYYSCVHIRFSTIFYSSQLVDIFAYELPLSSSQKGESNIFDSTLSGVSNSVLVYNFHNLTFQERLFFFCSDVFKTTTNFNLNSITELYPNSGWLEREVSELHGTVFNNKRDLRNLMLQYGDTSVPFRKSSPSIGVKEVFYDSVNDVIVQYPVSLQS